ncbi:hypothetical protein D3C84_422900 [compost metagenome]
MGHRHPQGAEGLVRHGAQLVAVKICQLALVEALLDVGLPRQPHYPRPVRLVAHQGFTGAEVVLAFQLETTAQGFNLALGHLQLGLGAGATGAGADEQLFDLLLVGAGFLLHVVRQGEPHGPQLLLELRQGLALGRGAGIERGAQLQRFGVALGNLLVLLTGSAGRQLGGFELLFEPLAHLRGLAEQVLCVLIGKVRQTGHQLIQRVATALLLGQQFARLIKGCLQGREILGILAQHLHQGLELLEPLAVLGDKGFGCFKGLDVGVGRLEAGRQISLGKQMGKGQHPLYQLDMASQLGGGRLGLTQLLVALADGPLQRAQLGLFGLHFGFRIGAEGDIQMLADKVAKMPVEAVVLLLLEGGLGVALDKIFPLKVELLDAFFPGGAAKERQLGVAGEAHLTLAGAHQHGVTELVRLHQILVKGVGVALDEVDILGAIFQLLQPLYGPFQIQYHQGTAGRAVEGGVVRGIVDGDVVIDVGEQHAPHLLGNAGQARIRLTGPQLQVANLQLQGLLLALDAVALLLELPLLVEHCLHTGRELLGGSEG